jgi:hypothetical protein
MRWDGLGARDDEPAVDAAAQRAVARALLASPDLVLGTTTPRRAAVRAA